MTQTPTQTDTHSEYAADTGTTTNSYVEAAVYKVLSRAGTIYVENTGGTNSLKVKFTNNFDVIIQYNGADETTIAHSSDLIFDIEGDDTGINEVKVNIKSASAGSHTTYSTESSWRR